MMHQALDTAFFLDYDASSLAGHTIKAEDLVEAIRGLEVFANNTVNAIIGEKCTVTVVVGALSEGSYKLPTWIEVTEIGRKAVDGAGVILDKGVELSDKVKQIKDNLGLSEPQPLMLENDWTSIFPYLMMAFVAYVAKPMTVNIGSTVFTNSPVTFTDEQQARLLKAYSDPKTKQAFNGILAPLKGESTTPKALTMTSPTQKETMNEAMIETTIENTAPIEPTVIVETRRNLVVHPSGPDLTGGPKWRFSFKWNEDDEKVIKAIAYVEHQGFLEWIRKEHPSISFRYPMIVDIERQVCEGKPIAGSYRVKQVYQIISLDTEDDGVTTFEPELE